MPHQSHSANGRFAAVQGASTTEVKQLSADIRPVLRAASAPSPARARCPSPCAISQLRSEQQDVRSQADLAAPFDDLVGATTERGHNTLILCIEPGIDNLSCLGNNRFFGTFLKRGGTFRQCSWRARSIDHCSPAFSDWTDQKAISLIIEFLCHFLARCSWLASFDHLVDVGAGVRAVASIPRRRGANRWRGAGGRQGFSTRLITRQSSLLASTTCAGISR